MGGCGNEESFSDYTVLYALIPFLEEGVIATHVSIMIMLFVLIQTFVMGFFNSVKNYLGTFRPLFTKAEKYFPLMGM